ncbi:MAG: rod-binding protein [Deltaproteobacteria bacterium]|nr:rod-binding protein [Deltaproteobacteria bacterium]
MDINKTAGINFPLKKPEDFKPLKDSDALNKASSQEVRQKQQLDKAATGFEALLLHEMLKSMWQTVEVKGWLGEDSNESRIYRDMMNQAISDSVSSGKGIGIKEVVVKEMEKGQTASQKVAQLKASGIDATYGSLLNTIIGDEGNENQ